MFIIIIKIITITDTLLIKHEYSVLTLYTSLNQFHPISFLITYFSNLQLIFYLTNAFICFQLVSHSKSYMNLLSPLLQLQNGTPLHPQIYYCHYNYHKCYAYSRISFHNIFRPIMTCEKGSTFMKKFCMCYQDIYSRLAYNYVISAYITRNTLPNMGALSRNKPSTEGYRNLSPCESSINPLPLQPILLSV